MNRVAQLEEALKLALEYWAHRQQRYKNRHPQWVQKARAALAERQPEAAPEGLIRNAALQEAAAHLRDMGYWTQASAVLSLCTNASASAPTPASAPQSFQARVQPWMLACFNEEIAADRLERGDRFIEEALELVQSGGYDKERAHALVEYVYGRPQGDVNQEVGGVMVTLAAYCLAFGVDMHVEAERELARINEPEIIEKIRAKQASKPNGSALPIATPASAVASEADPLQFTLGNGTVAVDTGRKNRSLSPKAEG